MLTHQQNKGWLRRTALHKITTFEEKVQPRCSRLRTVQDLLCRVLAHAACQHRYLYGLTQSTRVAGVNNDQLFCGRNITT